MTTQTEALKLPQEQHFYYAADDTRPVRKPLPLYTAEQMREYAQAAIKEALAQPEQEPVAWHVYFGNEDEPNYVCLGEKPIEKMSVIRPLVFGDTTPPQRTWVGLTQTEVVDILCEYNKLTGNVGWQQLIYMTEAKLKAKNERLEKNT